MGVKTLLGRLAVRRAHVLTVELPGYWTSRVRLEQAIAARGWRLASSPADADVLAVCGAPSGEWSDLIDRIKNPDMIYDGQHSGLGLSRKRDRRFAWTAELSAYDGKI